MIDHQSAHIVVPVAVFIVGGASSPAIVIAAVCVGAVAVVVYTDNTTDDDTNHDDNDDWDKYAQEAAQGAPAAHSPCRLAWRITVITTF